MSNLNGSFACPSWSAADRANQPASFINVATRLADVLPRNQTEAGALEGLPHHLESVGRDTGFRLFWFAVVAVGQTELPVVRKASNIRDAARACKWVN
jgi:hypothetical protein